MKIDRYTKGVLTVIAACLVWQCVMGLGRVVEARQAPDMARFGTAQPVVIVGWGEMNAKGEFTVFTKRRDGAVVSDPQLPYSSSSPLAVRVAQTPVAVSVSAPVTVSANPNAPLPVTIGGVFDTSGHWDPIRAKVEPEGTRRSPGDR